MTPVHHLLHIIAGKILSLSPCMNPIIYGALNKNFSRQYRRLFLRRTRRVITRNPEEQLNSNKHHTTRPVQTRSDTV